MDERIRFVIRLKDGESMAALCREFQISGKTGYKIFDRYEECGLEGLTDRAIVTSVDDSITYDMSPYLSNSGNAFLDDFITYDMSVWDEGGDLFLETFDE